MNERNVVTVRGLRKSYGKRVVVDGVDLTVAAGEIVGLPLTLLTDAVRQPWLGLGPATGSLVAVVALAVAATAAAAYRTAL